MLALDVDSHYNPPPEWLRQADPGLAARVPAFDPRDTFLELLYGDVLMAAVPRSFREQATAAFAKGVNLEAEDAQMMAAAAADRPETAPATERLAWMDDVGIEAQLVLFSDFDTYKAAIRAGERALGIEVLEASNTWIADYCHRRTDRLVPITLVDFADVDWTVRELTRMRGLGSRVFHFKFEPVNGRSVCHPGFERIWATANDLGMMLQIHIGGAQPYHNPGWFAMGDDVDFNTITRIASVQQHSGLQMGLAAMIHAGIFERYPRLGVVTAELDIRWVPLWLELLDGILVDSKWQSQGYLPKTYSYPLLPSEYAEQHVRVTPLATPTQSPRKLLDTERAGGMVAFSSDYCHFEGTGKDGPGWYRDVLDGYDDATKEHFYRGATQELFDRAAGLTHV